MNKMYKTNFPDVISEPMEGEQVVIDLKSGCYYNFNESAAYIWRMIEWGYSTAEIIGLLSHNGKIEGRGIDSLVEGFIDRLEDEKLIVPSESNCDTTAKADIPAVYIKFDIPAYQKFDDMQEMLLLDPIHEVSEAGWPNLPEGELN